jgi:small conductance mechanosensitive channel
MQEWWDKASVYIIQYGISFVTAILIFVIGKWVAKIISVVAEKAMEKAKLHKNLASFSKNIVYFGLLIFVSFVALNKLGVETNSFVAIIGAAGLAVGLALQGSLANFAAGVMIILLQPFEVGDTIEAGGAAGTVNEIQIFSTVILSENKRIIVPNAKITADKITVFQKAK